MWCPETKKREKSMNAPLEKASAKRSGRVYRE